MTNKEYEQRIEALEREIAELKSETVEDEPERPPHQRPKLEEGDLYNYIASDGTIIPKAWTDSLTDYGLRDFCNVFRTYDAAKYAAEYYKVLAQMREWAGKWDDPWKMSYDGYRVGAVKDYIICVTYGEIRFATEADAQNCIKKVGKDRLIKYYFGVRDHEIPHETE